MVDKYVRGQQRARKGRVIPVSIYASDATSEQFDRALDAVVEAVDLLAEADHIEQEQPNG